MRRALKARIKSAISTNRPIPPHTENKGLRLELSYAEGAMQFLDGIHE